MINETMHILVKVYKHQVYIYEIYRQFLERCVVYNLQIQVRYVGLYEEGVLIVYSDYKYSKGIKIGNTAVEFSQYLMTYINKVLSQIHLLVL